MPMGWEKWWEKVNYPEPNRERKRQAILRTLRDFQMTRRSRRRELDWNHLYRKELAQFGRQWPRIRDDGYSDEASMALLAIWIIGPNQKRVEFLTGLPKGKVRFLFSNWRRNGLIGRSRVHHSGWFDEEFGGVAFALETRS